MYVHCTSSEFKIFNDSTLMVFISSLNNTSIVYNLIVQLSRKFVLNSQFYLKLYLNSLSSVKCSLLNQ